MLRAQIDFSKKLRDWDGFGISYHPSEIAQIQENPGVIESLFGHEGLKAAILQIFLGPHNQEYTDSDSNEEKPINLKDYKHQINDTGQLNVCKSALEEVSRWGGGLKILVTCLSPPGWMTKQKEVSGRDLDSSKRVDYARYMVSYVKYLVEECNLPVKYLSIHNQAEIWELWNDRGFLISNAGNPKIYWPVEQLVDFIKLIRRLLDLNGLQHVGLTPGETQNWGNFYKWGYAEAIYDDPQALDALSILTSDSTVISKKYTHACSCNSAGIDLLRQKKTDLHAWSTSIRTSHHRVSLLHEIYNNIYSTKVNAIILDCSVKSTSISLSDSQFGNLNFAESNYFYIKPFFMAGQPGMGVSHTTCNGSEIEIIAFSSNSTRNPDSFLIINTSELAWEIPIEIRGSACGCFQAFRTSETENCLKLNAVSVREGKIVHTIPAVSITVFVGSVGAV
ncbi:MAG: hypothetical protein GX640_20620 [Fibrobacter sp.]|nr:hypothetical protein [Fibrobacter sp.]